MTRGGSGDSDSSAPLRQKAREVDFWEAGRRALWFLRSKWNVELEGLRARAGHGLSTRSAGQSWDPLALQRGVCPHPRSCCCSKELDQCPGSVCRARAAGRAWDPFRPATNIPAPGPGWQLLGRQLFHPACLAGDHLPVLAARAALGALGARRRLALLSLARISSVTGSDLIQGGFSLCAALLCSHL